ncbi:MAG: hypothetical protein D6753_11305 [Planctomycetota bacterium]|nr:MAG: hypothetical protein D6753_11305 [Planctomycetota bacterium]
MATSAPSTRTRPVHEVRLGRIKAAIWESTTDRGPIYNTTIVRVYMNGDKWQESHSFGRDELLVAAKALDMCHTWICAHQRTASRSSTDAAARSAR